MESAAESDARSAAEPVAESAAESAAESDALLELGDRIAELSAHIHAATQRLLMLIADFDERRGWEAGGHRSCAHWLHYRTGFALAACREKVRTARALMKLPQTSAAMAEGSLSFAKVRAMTRIATTDNESELLECARQSTANQLEQLVRSWKRFSRVDEQERERILHRSRTVSVFPDEDGMYQIRGRLDAEVGALLIRAIEAASDALYREDLHREDRHQGCRKQDGADAPSSAQRRADALGLLAERALAGGFGCRDGKATCISGTRAARYQVLLHVDADTLDAKAEPGRSHLEDGVRVSAETSRRLACDAGVVQVTSNDRGQVLDVGRRTRTIPPSIRRALEVRDGGCRFPGCGLRFTVAHHIKHWADGGVTKLSNLLLLCRHHHRLVHEEGWRVTWPPGCPPEFVSPRGVTVRRPARRPDQGAGDRVTALVDENRSNGVDPDWRTASAGCKRGDDIEIAVLESAIRALSRVEQPQTGS